MRNIIIKHNKIKENNDNKGSEKIEGEIKQKIKQNNATLIKSDQGNTVVIMKKRQICKESKSVYLTKQLQELS